MVRLQLLLLLVGLALLRPFAAASAAEPQTRTTTPLPAAWAAAVAAGDMLTHTHVDAAPLDPRLRPSIGNGHVATLGGSASVYLAGVYNLSPLGAAEPFRARLPGLAAVSVALPGAAAAAERSGSQAATAGGVCTNAPPTGRARCPSPASGPTPASCAAQGCCFIPAVATYCAAALNSSKCADKCQIESAASAPLAPRKEWADIEALDMKHAAFLQRKTVDLAQHCTVTISQRTYAHRVRLPLLVTDFTLSATAGCAAGTTLKLQPGVGADLKDASLQDFSWQQAVPHASAPKLTVASTASTATAATDATVYTGTTLKAEKQGRKIGVAFATLAPMQTRSSIEVAVRPGAEVVHSFPSAFVSDAASSQSPYGNPGTATTATSVMTLAKLASAALAAAVAIGPEALFAEHTAAVARDAEHGIDIEGDLALAQVVNSTLYSLRASLSPEVEWSTSPGGLPTGERKTIFLSHLYIKTIFLPRRARDKHWENSRTDRFL